MITIRHLQKHFGPKKVLKDVSLEIPRGSALVLIGASGSGKSVLLKCLLGLLEPNGGEMIIDGQKITGENKTTQTEINRHIGMLFQSGALFDSLTVGENVAFRLLSEEKTSPQKAHAEAVDSLKQVGLGKEVASLYPAALSGGMRKRAGLARAITGKPNILFFDEPTTGLDPINSDVINKLVLSCSQKLGATTLTITHDMTSVRKIADYVAMLHDGRIIWHGPKKEMDKCDNEFVQQFINGRAEGPITDRLSAGA